MEKGKSYEKKIEKVKSKDYRVEAALTKTEKV